MMCFATGLSSESARSAFVADVVSQLARILTESGFPSALRTGNAGGGAVDQVLEAKRAERQRQLRDAGRRLIVAALLASACFTGHLSHIWPGESLCISTCNGMILEKMYNASQNRFLPEAPALNAIGSHK